MDTRRPKATRPGSPWLDDGRFWLLLRLGDRDFKRADLEAGSSFRRNDDGRKAFALHFKLGRNVRFARRNPLNAPYFLVVTDCKEELPGGKHSGEALLEAVLGTIYTEVKVSETGEQTVTERRKPDGYWGVVGAPAHTQVSAIALLPKPHSWDLRTERWHVATGCKAHPPAIGTSIRGLIETVAIEGLPDQRKQAP